MLVYSSVVRGCNSCCIAVPVCTGIPVSRKKILILAHPPAALLQQRERARCTNVDPCVLIRPTLSACCDESQLLLGIPHLAGRAPTEESPRHNRYSLCLRYGSAVSRDQNLLIIRLTDGFLIGYPHIGFHNNWKEEDINICQRDLIILTGSKENKKQR
jgi:hypothetical protein